MKILISRYFKLAKQSIILGLKGIKIFLPPSYEDFQLSIFFFVYLNIKMAMKDLVNIIWESRVLFYNYVDWFFRSNGSL